MVTSASLFAIILDVGTEHFLKHNRAAKPLARASEWQNPFNVFQTLIGFDKGDSASHNLCFDLTAKMYN